ncbi:hypothetical protein BC938DRAFT_472239 [Jimgerdemannia flammicorona]|uniref:SET domain-containing protein n=1 Tax=Jimgerdemannia flammicorona TaxID=994334 RepID=A0A433Q6L5_9FUNG|nr:hypothetical protein BC938DRAFT_472239 [Jimgerdemannia flammicorona]
MQTVGGGIIADISSGLEPVPVALEYSSQEKLDELQAVHTRYIVHSIIPGREDDRACYYDGCDCSSTSATNLCLNESRCGCIAMHGCYYTRTNPPLLTLLLDLQPSNSPTPPIYECNSSCACPPTCPNRLVQHGCRVPMRVFHTGTARGWSVQVMRAVRRGEFVCEYAGEVVRAREIRKRRWGEGSEGTGTGNYVLCLREYVCVWLLLILYILEPSENGAQALRTNIDPTTTANLGRYINHSCSPNLSLFPVRVDSVVPLVGMFAYRDIAEGEELGFDYAGVIGYGDEVTPSNGEETENGRTRCLCNAGAGVCRGWLPFDARL